MNNSTTAPERSRCTSAITSWSIFTAWFAVYLLFLPLFLFVLYIGFNKWNKPQSSASRGLSHSDVFTLHMVAMEMTSIFGSCAICYGFYMVTDAAVTVGEDVLATTVTGQVLFHSLTCVERYLAVVHPVTYLRLRGEGGVTVRNISIALVWLFSIVYTLVLRFCPNNLLYILWSFLLSSVPLSLVIYCSVFVLCVLIRPKPGERGGHRKRISQSKRSTVYTVAAILLVLVLRLIVGVLSYSIPLLHLTGLDGCVLKVLSFWLMLPSSLVLPLLFLQRVGSQAANRAK